MKALDLFAGIGGITHALRGLGIQPAAYCERDPVAIGVLRQRMRTGDLPAAPIHTDVERFPGKEYRGKITVLTAGFPCPGFSSMKMNQRDGFDHPGSALFRHVVRLIDEISPPIVFLENVACIRTEGMGFVVESIRQRGYEVSWVSLRGHHVGAPQHRHRWFCLATKIGYKKILQCQKFKRYDWSREPTRLTLSKDGVTDRRVLLGNSVIPDVVRFAFLYLWTGSCLSLQKIFGMTSYPHALPNGTHPGTQTPASTDNPPACGFFNQKKMYALPLPPGVLSLPASRQRVLDPKTCTQLKKSPLNTLAPHAAPITITTWATPRHGGGGSRVLTARTERDLGTQLRFAVDTPDALRSGDPHPEFVEWLMGFPKGWTNSLK